MRFLIIGLGSMGKRRIRNLKYHNVAEIFGFDPRADRREEAAGRYGIRTFGNIDLAIDEARPDAVVISTPPDLHVHYAHLAMDNNLHFFVEASVVDDGMDDLIARSQTRPHLVAAPSCTMRYQPSIKTVKSIVESGTFGKPLLLTYHVGQWLPDWHPWEDYRSFYASKRATGACREIVPFELSWLTWVLGPVAAVVGIRRKLSSLDVDIDDTYQVLLEFRSGLLGHLLVDVIARAPVRSFRLCSESATVEWDWLSQETRFYSGSNKTWETVGEPPSIQDPGYVKTESAYIEEMSDFIAACQGEKPWPYSLEENRLILNLLSAVERSSDTERLERIA